MKVIAIREIPKDCDLCSKPTVYLFQYKKMPVFQAYRSWVGFLCKEHGKEYIKRYHIEMVEG